MHRYLDHNDLAGVTGKKDYFCVAKTAYSAFSALFSIFKRNIMKVIAGGEKGDRRGCES